MNLFSITASLKCIFKEFTDSVDGFPNQVLKMSDLLLFLTLIKMFHCIHTAIIHLVSSNKTLRVLSSYICVLLALLIDDFI